MLNVCIRIHDTQSLIINNEYCQQISFYRRRHPKSITNRNPNEHHRQDSVLAASKERNRFRSITWEQYDPIHQKYLEIGKRNMLSLLCINWFS